MKARTALVLSSLATLPAVVLGAGFCFHTSLDPVVFGKYGSRYAVFLGAWIFLVIPAWFGLARFVFRTHHVVLSGGRRRAVGPGAKIAGGLVLAVFGCLALDFATGVAAARRTTTFHADVVHPYLQNTPNPDSPKLGVNRFGFRGSDLAEPKPPNEFRIFVFGGSTVFCGSLAVAETPCGMLERMLRATRPDRDIRVQNAGADWHCSQHSLIKLAVTVQHLEPDLIIVYHGINDLYRSFVPDAFADGAYRDDYAHYLGALANMADPARARATAWRSYLGFWFSDFRSEVVPVLGPDGNGINGKRVIFFPKARAVEIDDWPSLRPFERNLRTFVTIARSRGATVVLASQPHLYRSDLGPRERAIIWFPSAQQQDGRKPSLASMIDGMRRFNDAAETVARDLDTPFIDLDAAVPRTLEHFYDDVHTTRAGNEVIARSLHDFIVTHGLVGRQ